MCTIIHVGAVSADFVEFLEVVWLLFRVCEIPVDGTVQPDSLQGGALHLAETVLCFPVYIKQSYLPLRNGNLAVAQR